MDLRLLASTGALLLLPGCLGDPPSLRTEDSGADTVAPDTALDSADSSYADVLADTLDASEASTDTVDAAPPEWKSVGEGWVAMIGGPNLYAKSSTGALSVFDPTAETWKEISGPVKYFAQTSSALFTVDTDEKAVRRYLGVPFDFELIGNNSAGLFGTGPALYSFEVGDGFVWRYNDTPTDWTRVATSALDVAANDLGTYRVTVGPGQNIERLSWSGGSPVWTTIGFTASRVYANEKELIMATPGFALLRYAPGTGTTSDWVSLAQEAREVVIGRGKTAAGVQPVFAIPPDRMSVVRWDGDMKWTTVGGPAQSLALTPFGLFSLGADKIIRRARHLEPITP